MSVSHSLEGAGFNLCHLYLCTAVMTALFCHRGKRLFLLKGKTNKEKRMRIYKFLLEHFTDEQRFNVTSKICLNILGMSGVFGVNVFLECC